MRINRYVALATGFSRRASDKLIENGQIRLNGAKATQGLDVKDSDRVYLHEKLLSLPTTVQTIVFNKPTGYVCSRDGQGSKTIYDILPAKFHHLKPVGRLDKESSGLLLMTNDGELAHQLTHPSFNKTKVYEVKLSKSLEAIDRIEIEKGIALEDGVSALNLNGAAMNWTITMTEGRNRQIRRTFDALGYKITKLHRITFGPYKIGELASGNFEEFIVK